MKVWVLIDGMYGNEDLIGVYTQESLADNERDRRLEINRGVEGYGITMRQCELTGPIPVEETV
jgi:hypothetical protein